MFATQLSSILVSSEVSRELDVSAVFEFFNYQKVLGTKTFIKHVRTQPPATILHYSKGNITLTQYWKMQYDEERFGEKEYVDELAATIEGSVKRLTNGNETKCGRSGRFSRWRIEPCLGAGIVEKSN